MAKTQEELKEIKEEYKALTKQLKELSEDELATVVGGAIDFKIGINDDTAFFLLKAYDYMVQNKDKYIKMEMALGHVEFALRVDNNEARLMGINSAINLLEIDPNKDNLIGNILCYLELAKGLIPFNNHS